MELKTELTIELKAGDVLVAESSDAVLWQKVLSVITAPKNSAMSEIVLGGIDEVGGEEEGADVGGALVKFSKALNVDVNVVKGAIDPSNDEPYIDIDKIMWSKWKKNVPSQGKDAISDYAIISTIIKLWSEYSNIGEVDTKMISKVFKKLGVSTKNPTRSITNCEWLQLKSKKQIIINPAKIEFAIEMVKAFCLGSTPMQIK